MQIRFDSQQKCLSTAKMKFLAISIASVAANVKYDAIAPESFLKTKV
jgi:hypothetical protein